MTVPSMPVGHATSQLHGTIVQLFATLVTSGTISAVKKYNQEHTAY